jgi:hypothetical protein
MTKANLSAAGGLQTGPPHASIHNSIEAWQRGIIARDWNAVGNLLADDVSYYNPATFDPYMGKNILVTVLRTVFDIFQDFEYLRQFHGDAGYVLEFSSRVGDEKLSGVDIVELNERGLIRKLTVMIRPANVVLTLSAQAAKRLSGVPFETE